MTQRSTATSPANHIATLEELEAAFDQAGGTHDAYLRVHYPRFAATKHEFDRTWQHGPGMVLDIGAHWLQQAVIWALDGWRVDALDVAATLDTDISRNIAQAHNMRLLINDDLENPARLSEMPPDSVDVVLFTEVIEHLAFNPIDLWREIHRVLRVGGRIVLTTPNYYALRGRAWQPLRFICGRGAGLRIEQILEVRSFGHHWKEYSLQELDRYFEMLGPDFRIAKALRMREFNASRFTSLLGRTVMGLERSLPLLRPNLHLEIELVDKSQGITVETHW